MKHLTFGVLLILGLQTLGLAQYPLSVESYPAVQEGLTTYRFFVNMQDATDRISAVYGNNEAGLYVNAPEGAYNNLFNSSWSASGINPAFLPIYPEMADDTYATIGLTGPAATSGLDGAADPSIVEDTEQPITPFFQTNGATTLESNTLTGSSWYVLNTASNGLPDANLQVLVLQVTTSGSISGTINYQVFPLGVGANAVYQSENFSGEPLEDVFGCTDEASCTYNPEATVDDGSCLYLDAVGVCGGDCEEASPDSPTVCAGDEVYGCTNLDACNYDPMANISDGSCVGTPDNFCDCEGTIPDSDNDGVCDEDEVEGCTDGMACNYSADATDDDGSCEYCSCGESAFTLTVDTMAAVQEGLTTYRVYVNTLSESDRVSAVFSNVDYPMTINVPEGAWNSPNSTTWNASGVNPSLLIDFPNIVDDSYATIGLTGPAAPLGAGYQDPSLVDPDMALTNFFTVNGSTGFTSDTNPGLSWFVLSTAVNGLPDEDGRVLLMQITTSGSINGTLNYQVFPQGNQDADIVMTTSFEGVGTFGQVNVCGCMQANACNFNPDANYPDPNEACEYDSCNGCMDETACNYDETATLDDGTNCEYPDAGYNCDGSCIDSNMNEVCDFDEQGCTDETACNYDGAAAFDDGSCEFAEEYYDCDGNCLMDSDDDGVCDELEVAGCTDEAACNYNEDATDEDGSCEYAAEYYDCDGNCLNDADGDGVCDELEIAGCTNMEACNYDELATEDDGSCILVGDACDDGDENTINDAIDENCDCVGEIIDGLAESQIAFGMFPNPTTGEVTVAVAGVHAAVTIQVLDGAGRVVWTEQNVVLQGNTVLDLSGLSSGTYNVMLSDERGVSVQRLAIQH